MTLPVFQTCIFFQQELPLGQLVCALKTIYLLPIIGYGSFETSCDRENITNDGYFCHDFLVTVPKEIINSFSFQETGHKRQFSKENLPTFLPKLFQLINVGLYIFPHLFRKFIRNRINQLRNTQKFILKLYCIQMCSTGWVNTKSDQCY